VYSNPRIASDSSCFKPTMRREKPWLTYLMNRKRQISRERARTTSDRDVQRLFSRDGVTAHERVDAANRLALDRLGAVQLGGALRLLEPGVLDLERLEVLAEGRREALVRLDLVHEERVAAVLRCIE
jgi:hypothetical protein